MLYSIAQELEAALKAQGVPFSVIFGPEPTESVGTRNRIVFEHVLDEKRDSVTAPKSTHVNPPVPLNRLQAARIRIFARSAKPGARWCEHAELVEHVLDHVQAELDHLVRARKNSLTFGAGGFVTPLDEKGAKVLSGAAYELDVTIDRAVFRRNWAGEAADEVTIGKEVSISNRGNVSLNGQAAEAVGG